MAERVQRSESTLKALHGAFCRGAPRETLLQLAANKINEAGPPYDRVYIYLLVNEALGLHAFAGRELESNVVNLDSGAQAVSQKLNVYIPDTASEGCATHSPTTKSKLVVLIRRHDEILGAIDVESDETSAFSDAQQATVREVADGLAALL